MAKPVVHADSGSGIDYTLCGFGAEGDVLANGDEPPVFASPGETVTCKDCRRVIAYCKTFKRNRQP